jgi:tripartite-type tricarboxylate transporter receptor subunit TctC
LVAPRGTPKPMIDKLNAGVVAAMGDAAVRERFIEFGAEPLTSTPEELERFISAEVVKWRELIARAGIKLEQ